MAESAKNKEGGEKQKGNGRKTREDCNFKGKVEKEREKDQGMSCRGKN